MSFPLEPITNSTTPLASNGTELSTQLPIIAVNSSQAALATMAPNASTAPNVELPSALTTNVTTTLFQGYSSATTWSNVAQNTSPSATQAGRRAQTSRADEGSQSEQPRVRRRVKREASSTESATDSTAQSSEQHIGKIMCGGNKTHPITKDDFTFANVFPAHPYSPDEAVERCAQLAFDPKFKDCKEGVEKVCEALLKHFNIEGSDVKLSPSAFALLEFMKNVTEDSLNQESLLKAADQKIYEEKIEQDNYIYYPHNSQNSFKGDLTGEDIKIKQNGTDLILENQVVTNAIIKNVTLPEISFPVNETGIFLELKESKNSNYFNFTTTYTTLSKSGELEEDGGSICSNEKDNYDVYLKEKKEFNSTLASFDNPINITGQEFSGDVFSAVEDISVTENTKQHNFSSAIISGNLKGKLDAGIIASPIRMSVTVNTTEPLINGKNLTEISQLADLIIVNGTVKKHEKIELTNSFNISRWKSVVNLTNFANKKNYQINQTSTITINPNEYDNVNINSDLVISDCIVNLQDRYVSGVVINKNLTDTNIKTNAEGYLEKNSAGALLIPKSPSNSTPYYYTIDEIPNCKVTLKEEYKIKDVRLNLRAKNTISYQPAEATTLNNVTIHNATFTPGELKGNKTIQGDDKEFIRVHKPIKLKLNDIENLKLYNLTKDATDNPNDNDKKEAAKGRQAEAQFKPKLAHFLNQKTTWQPPQPIPPLIGRFLDFLYDNLHDYAKFTVFFIGAASGVVLTLVVGGGITKAIFRKAQRDEWRAQIFHRKEMRELRATDTSEAAQQNPVVDFNPEVYVDESLDKKRKHQQAKVPNLEEQLEQLAAENNNEEGAAEGAAAAAENELMIEVPDVFIQELLAELELREREQTENAEASNEVGIQANEVDLLAFDEQTDESADRTQLAEKYLKQVAIKNDAGQTIRNVMVSVADQAPPHDPCKSWFDKLSQEFTATLNAATPETTADVAKVKDDIELQLLVATGGDNWSKQFLELDSANTADQPTSSVVMADEQSAGSSQPADPASAPAPANAAPAGTATAAAPLAQQAAAAGGAGDPDDDDPDQNKKQGKELKKQCEKDEAIPVSQAKKKSQADKAINVPEDGDEGDADRLEAQEQQAQLPEYHKQYVEERSRLSDQRGELQKAICQKESALEKLQIERVERQVAHYLAQGITMPRDLTVATAEQKQLHAADAILQQRKAQQQALIKEIKLAKQQELHLAQQEKITACQNALVQAQHHQTSAARRAAVAQEAFEQGHMSQTAYNTLLAGNCVQEATADLAQLQETSAAVFAASAVAATVRQRAAGEQLAASLAALADSQVDAGYLSSALALAENLAQLQLSSQRIRSACRLARQAEQSKNGVNAALAALKALQLSRAHCLLLIETLEQTSAQNSLSSGEVAKWRASCNEQVAALEKSQQDLNSALPELTAASTALSSFEIEGVIASCIANCDLLGQKEQEFITAASTELRERLVECNAQDVQARRNMEQQWQLSATASRYLPDLQSHATCNETLLSLFFNNGRADPNGQVDKPFTDRQRAQLVEQITGEQQTFVKLVRQTQIEIAASYDPSSLNQNALEQALGQLQTATANARAAIDECNKTLFRSEFEESRRVTVTQNELHAKNALAEVTKLLAEAQQTRDQAQARNSKNLEALNKAVATLTEYRDRLQTDVTDAQNDSAELDDRTDTAKRGYLQAKQQAMQATGALAQAQHVLLTLLARFEKQCHDTFLANKQALAHQPLLADLSLHACKDLAKRTLSVVKQAVSDAEQCEKAGSGVTEQLERLGQISQHQLFIKQSKKAAAEANHWLRELARAVDNLHTQQAWIARNTRWPDKTFEAISYNRLRVQQALSAFIEALQLHLEAQERQLRTPLSKLNTQKLALSKCALSPQNTGPREVLIKALERVYAFDKVHDWQTLSHTQLLELNNSCQEALGKLVPLQDAAALQKDHNFQCLLDGITDDLNALARYALLVLDGRELYAELTTAFEDSERALHALCMQLREQNPRLNPPDFSPVYYGRGIRDYFAAQHQQRLEQVQGKQASSSERVQDAALKLFSVYKMGAAAETQDLLKWQTDDKDKIAAAAKKASEPITTTLSRIDAMLGWDNTKAASKQLLQENREELAAVLTSALTNELPALTAELEYRAIKHHRPEEKALAQVETDLQQEVVGGRIRRLAAIAVEMEKIAVLNRANKGRVDQARADAFTALEKEQQQLLNEQEEYESAQRKGQASKALLEAPVGDYKGAMRQQAERYLVGGGLSAAEKAQLVEQLSQTLQPLLQEAARQGAVAQTEQAQAEIYKKTITQQLLIEDDPAEAQEAADEEIDEGARARRLKFTGQSQSVSQSLIEQAAGRIASAMAARVNIRVDEKVLTPITDAVVAALQVALQEKYGQLLEEKAEQKGRTARIQEIKFKAAEYEKMLIAGKPELALMAEHRYELEQKRDARAQLLRQQLQAKLAKFDAELAKLSKEQQQCAAEGKTQKSQKLLVRINKMTAGRINVEAEIQADNTVKNLNKEIAAIIVAMDKRALAIPTLTLQQDAVMRTQQLADQLRGAAAAEDTPLAELHAAAEPELAQARLYHEPAQASKEYDNVKIKFGRS